MVSSLAQRLNTTVLKTKILGAIDQVGLIVLISAQIKNGLTLTSIQLIRDRSRE